MSSSCTKNKCPYSSDQNSLKLLNKATNKVASKDRKNHIYQWTGLIMTVVLLLLNFDCFVQNTQILKEIQVFEFLSRFFEACIISKALLCAKQISFLKTAFFMVKFHQYLLFFGKCDFPILPEIFPHSLIISQNDVETLLFRDEIT